MEQKMQQDAGWNWVGRYVAVIVLSLILAAAIGNMELFSKTAIGGKLSASHIVQFLGYGAALATLWVFGQRATITLQRLGGKWSFLQHLILPAVSLVVVSLAYTVLLLLLRPYLDATLHNVYNWVFIVAILACSGWLVMAVLNHSAALTELFTSAAEQMGAKQRTCPSCGASSDAAAKFCKQCGKPLDSAS